MKKGIGRPPKPVLLGLKECARCHEWKEIQGFGVYKRGARGIGAYCRECGTQQNQNWKRKNAARYLLYGAKSRARRFGLAFNLDVKDIVIPDRCPVLGLKLEACTGRGRRNSPSLDRLIPSKGYVKGNVFVVSFRVNQLKSDASADELEKIAAYVRTNQDK